MSIDWNASHFEDMRLSVNAYSFQVGQALVAEYVEQLANTPPRWRCIYCTSMHHDTEMRCDSCGAPR